MCTEEIHQMLIQEENAINCIFCCKQIQDPGKPKRYFCCSNMKLVKDGYLVCINCGQVHDYLTANESVYHRKYHIINVMNDIAQTNGIQIGYYNRENILRIFKLIDNVTHQPGVRRKRLISVNFIIKQLFDMLGIEYKFIPLTKSKKTLNYYSQWWAQIYDLIKEDIN